MEEDRGMEGSHFSEVEWRAHQPQGESAAMPWREVEERRAARAGVRIANRLFPIVLFWLDVAVWVILYVTLSISFGSTNSYGPAELTLPLVVMAISLSLVGGYKARGNMVSLRYAAEHCIACISGLVVAALALYLIANYGTAINSSRGIFLVTAIGFTALSLLHRRLIWFTCHQKLQKRSLLIIADADRGQEFLRAYRAAEQYQELEFLATDPNMVGRSVDGPDSPVYVAAASDLPKLLHAHPEYIHESIVVAADGSKLPSSFLNFLATVHFQDLPVYSIQGFYEAYWEKMPLYLLRPTWPLQAGFHLVKHSAFATAKRATDVLLSAIALILLLPLFGILAVAVRLDSTGPVIFCQTRVGQHRRPFSVYKFRTMRVGSEHKGIYTEKNDPRITRIGRFLRASRLDEIPQLFNVLRGDMSLIGPRAEWIKCVEQYENVIPHYHFRHLVRPGITGWAQVNYPYGANIKDTVEKLMYDLYYIRNFSLHLDAAVILKTIHVMLFGKGR